MVEQPHEPKQSFTPAGATRVKVERWSESVSEGGGRAHRGEAAVTATGVNKYKVHHRGMERGSL